jgi:hypothetical protein
MSVRWSELTDARKSIKKSRSMFVYSLDRRSARLSLAERPFQVVALPFAFTATQLL